MFDCMIIICILVPFKIPSILFYLLLTYFTFGMIGERYAACGLQTTQPTSGGAVTVVSSCCANCVEPPRPQQWGPDLPFLGMPAMRTRWMAGAAAHKSGLCRDQSRSDNFKQESLDL